MNRLLFFFAVFILPFCVQAQKTVAIRNLWAKPEVHVLYQGYTVSFTIRDINRALELLSQNGIATYGSSSGLDTLKEHSLELYPGYRQEYRNVLQPMLQLGVGAFLLANGRAEVRDSRHKKLKSITMDILPFIEGEHVTDIKFFDPGSGKQLFNGRIAESMLHADLGIDYW